MIIILTYEIDENISLKMFTEHDAEEFYHLTMDSKEYLKEWLGWLDYIKSVEDTAKFIKERLKLMVKNGGFPTVFAIMYKEEIAGTIGFNEIDKMDRVGTVGYWLGEKFQGKGIMTKSFTVLIDYGFKELNLNKMVVKIAVDNKKSRAIPERIGFVEEGLLRQAEWLYDHYVDHVIYGLLAEEWKEI